MKRGNCFHDALLCLVHMEDHRWTLVHGLPIGTGPQNKGKRYTHGWLQSEELGLCWDPNARRTVPTIVYYAVGQIREESTRRYTLAEALAMVDKSGHTGPWEPLVDEHGNEVEL